MVALPAWAIATLAVASAATTAIGAISSGNAAAAAAGNNARALEQAAVAEQQQGTIAYEQQKRKGMIQRGQTLAALAGSGIDPSEGTPLELLSEQAKVNEFDAENAKYAHDMHAWQLRNQENQQWDAARAAGSQAAGKVIGGVVQAGVLAGASGAFGDLLTPAVSNIGPTGATFAEELAAGVRPV
jgi:hypothetical protein